MSSLRKIDLDRANAELAEIEHVLSKTGVRDFLTRASLKSRKTEVLEFIRSFELEPEQGQASIALFFGGKPVIASEGIQSDFASSAIGAFQDLVAKYFANLEGELGQRGVVPHKEASKLHITNIVRGSFGFLLEEAAPQRMLVETKLKEAVDGVNQLIAAMANEDDVEFDEKLDAVDGRVLDSAKVFFETVKTNEATFKSIASGKETSFTRAAISKAMERANSVIIRESEIDITGMLIGALPTAHRFEIRLQDSSDIVSGSIDRSISSERIGRILKDLIDQKVRATVNEKLVFRNGTQTRKTFRLLDIDEDA